MPKTNLCIEVLGTSIFISADEEQDYLNGLLEAYKKAVEDTQASTGTKDPLKTAILTGFLLCDEVEKARQAANRKKNTEDREAEALTVDLISRLDGVLDGKSSAAEKTAGPEASSGP